MSDHAADHSGPGAHSHIKLYGITAAILTVVTIIELAILFVPADSGLKATVIPTLYVLSFAKLGGVIGIFMHLKDDRNIFRLLFLSPFGMAILMIVVLVIMASRYYAPFGLGEPALAVEKVGQKQWTAEEIEEYRPEAKAMAFAPGKSVFEQYCASCHRVDGGGATGPNLTDDCYLHGGTVANLSTTISNGVQGTAMPPWKPIIGEENVAHVTLYVESLRGKNVEEGKTCQGDKFAGAQ